MKTIISIFALFVSVFVLTPQNVSAQALSFSEFSTLFKEVTLPYSSSADFTKAKSGSEGNYKAIPAQYLTVKGFFNQASGKAWAVGKFKVSENVLALLFYTDNSGPNGLDRSLRVITYDKNTGKILGAFQLSAESTVMGPAGESIGNYNASSTINADFGILCEFNSMKPGSTVTNQKISSKIAADGTIQ